MGEPMDHHEYLGRVMHAVLRPLTPLQSAVDMLLDGTLGSIPDHQRDVLAMMGRNIDRLSRLAKDVHLLARLDAGQYPLRTESVDVREALHPVAAMLRDRGKGEGAIVAYQVAEGIHVDADPEALRTIALNLGEIALEHGGPGITLRLAADVHDGLLRISVSATGDGFSELERAAIFEPFSLVHHKERDGFLGTGLAMAVSRRLARALGGDVGLDPESKDGTRFIFTLRVHDDDEAPFGRIAVMRGYVSPRQVEWARSIQQGTDEDRRLGEILVDEGLMSAEQRDQVLKLQTEERSA